VWAGDLSVVEREFTFVGVKPELDEFLDLGAQMHAGPLQSAREAGRALGVVAAA
jgi:FMN-dependent NADH-azoreductase